MVKFTSKQNFYWGFDMKNQMLLRKTCGVYASDTHFATMIFPFIRSEVKGKTKILTILEKGETDKIEKILENVGLEERVKREIRNLDWSKTNIKKIRNNFKKLEKNIYKKYDTDVIVLGNKAFIKKVNNAIDLWFNNNVDKIEKSKVKINIINCFSFYENSDIYSVINSHNYILKTKGIIGLREEKLLKAN